MNRPGTLPWPGWRVVRRLGSGSYGSVFEIEREQFGIHERAALKVISFPKDPGELEEWRQSGYDDQTLAQSYRRQMERVLNEYKLLMELKGTSHIVNCDTYEVIAHPDGIGWDIYLRMELLTPLKSYLGNKITQRQVVALGADLCDALACCQQLDIIHRDIKPDNILVANNGDYKLGDFGIAKTTEKTMAGTRAGTPGFIAPEVYHNQPYGKSVDIYSLGMVLYWMLNHRVLPFLPLPPQMPSPDEMQEALLRRMRGEALPRPADGSRALQDVVLKACAYRPEDRYRTPEQLREALLAAARNASAESTDGSWSTPGDDPMSYTQTQGNNWETTGGCDDSDYTETNNTDPTMGTMGTEGGASASSEARRQDAGTRGKDVYTLVRITPQEAATGCKVETKDTAGRTVCVAIPQGVENGAVIRVNGHGAAGIDGGAPGDLQVRVYVQSAPAQKSAPAPKVQTTGTAAQKRKCRKIWIAAAAALLVACIAYIYGFAASDVEFDSDSGCVLMSGHITAITVGRAERLLSEHDCTVLSVGSAYYDQVLGTPTVSAFAMRRLGTLTNLTSLRLFDCDNISDLSPLSNLTNLTSLNLGSCDNISDLTPLSNLTNLTSLDLFACDNISDFTPLSNLTNLTSLDLDSCDNISVLTPLSNLTNLEVLDIRWTDVKSLHGLENARKLRTLYAEGCNLTDTSALEVSGCMSALRTN